MKTNILILIVATTGLFSCRQGSILKTDTVDIETYNSVRNYEYVDSMGNRLIMHNSTIKMESKEGEGSTFIIQLPTTA